MKVFKQIVPDPGATNELQHFDIEDARSYVHRKFYNHVDAVSYEERLQVTGLWSLVLKNRSNKIIYQLKQIYDDKH